MRKATWISVSIAALAFVGMVDASYVAIHSSRAFFCPVELRAAAIRFSIAPMLGFLAFLSHGLDWRFI